MASRGFDEKVDGTNPAFLERGDRMKSGGSSPTMTPASTSTPTLFSSSSSSSSPDLEADIGGNTEILDGVPIKRLDTAPSPYFTLPLWRKSLIVFITSWTTLSITFSSTSLFSAVNEISSEFHTTTMQITLSNAAVLLVMGCSSFIWVPIGRIVGRRWAWISAIAVVLVCSIGVAVVPDMKSFVALRLVGALQGTCFHVFGQAILADIFEPIQRGTATGFFLFGTVLGPPLGPCIAGVILTFTSWRVIIWLQVAMIGSCLLLSCLFLPDIRRETKVAQKPSKSQIVQGLKQFNIMNIFKLMAYPNVLFTDLTCGLLSWSQYTLLSAPRHLLNPRFHLTTPLVSGLFYLAPGIGFLVGAVIGGRFSDMTVRKWICVRGGLRLPQDRLNSGMISFFLIIPAAFLVYGWGLQYEVGGLALPIISAFFCGAGLLFAFASVNTYCAEVLPRNRTEVIAGKYFTQYCFSACGSAAIVPLIDGIGIGPASMIGVTFVFIAGVLALTTAKYGLTMQVWMEDKLPSLKRRETI